MTIQLFCRLFLCCIQDVVLPEQVDVLVAEWMVGCVTAVIV